MSFGTLTITRLLGINFLKNELKAHKSQEVIRRQYNKDVSQTFDSQSKEPEAKELKFAVPYGHLAAKEWGNLNGLPVLAVHGWLDNCGSFDPLIPYILKPNDLHIVAFDQPGSGLSSHKPPGSEYGRWEILKEMKRVVDHLKWKKFTIIGHSHGGNFALMFGAIYPHLVDRIIALDIPKPITYHGDNWVQKVDKITKLHLKYESYLSEDGKESSNIPVYSEEEALRLVIAGNENSLTEQSARILMKRGTKKVKSGLTFSRDIRLKLIQLNLNPPPTDHQMLPFMSNLKCDLLMIRAKQTTVYTPDQIREKYYEVYRNNCRIFKDFEFDGTHHLHMNSPEIVSPVINEFITESINSKIVPKL